MISREWQNRPLGSIYPVVFFDGIVFNSRKDNKIINKCVYSVLDINMEGQKEILGTWISENESASFCARICAGLKNRGVSDIFISCHDNFTGLCNAITSIFPKRAALFGRLLKISVVAYSVVAGVCARGVPIKHLSKV